MVMPVKNCEIPAATAAALAQSSASPVVPAADPEVGTTPQRRRFSTQDKLRILTEADQAAAGGASGAIGVLLRREGIYSSMLGEWRRQREAGIFAGLAPHKRGPKAEPANPLEGELKQLRRENTLLKARLARAEQIMDVQKKLSEMLAIPLNTPIDDGTI